MSIEQTNEKNRIKIVTNGGFKYSGILLDKNNLFIKILDDKIGEIEIPLSNISFMQEEK